MYGLISAACWCLGATPRASADLAFEDIRHWVGEGTNAVVVVLDWNRSGVDSAFAWGYRWNGGPVTQAQVLRDLSAADPRLHGQFMSTAWGTYVSGFGYDVNDNGGTFNFTSRTTSDPVDLLAVDRFDTTSFWAATRAHGASFAACVWQTCMSGADDELLRNGDWTAHKFIRWDVYESDVPAEPRPAEPRMARVFDNVHFWVGAGEHAAVLVVDWSDDARPNRALAWGYRWTGATPPTLGAVLRAIAHEDRRLHAFTGTSAWGTALYALGYDADGDGGYFRYAHNGGNIVAQPSDPDDLMMGGWNFATTPGFWEVLVGGNAVRFDAGHFAASWDGLDGTLVTPGSWNALRFSFYAWDWSQTYPLNAPVPAQSPYAIRVVDSHLDTRPNFNRWSNVQTVLGRPTVDTTSGAAGSTALVPVTPCIPPWTTGAILSLVNTGRYDGDELIPGTETNAYVVVEFDRPVVDHPLNPYGLDFIVFGNAFQIYSAQHFLTGTENPATVTMRAGLMSEPGLVEVSQDGVTWFRFANGPFADAFAPTMGRHFDTNNPVATLFAGNAWWGRPADATLPVDPSVLPAHLNNKTLAQVATYYKGSAGGTGFDIGGFNLPPNRQGRKWIRFARVTNRGSLADGITTEVDAFAAVTPDLPYDAWARANYAWTELPDARVAGRQAIAANGMPNFFNAALGVARHAPAPRLALTGVRVAHGTATLTFPCAQHADDAHFVVQRKHDLTAPAWSAPLSATRGPTRPDGNGGFVGTLSVPLGSEDAGFFRIGIGPGN